MSALPTYIGYCCREWILAIGARKGTCGYCGDRPTYLRPDDANPLNTVGDDDHA